MLRIGFGKVDVTPPLEIPYLSYYPRQTPFAGVHDRLFARALAAEQGGTRAAIVSVDSIGLSRTILGPGRDLIAEVRERVERQTGIPAADVLVAATHAHSTPQTTDLAPLVERCPPAAAWLERLLDQIAAAVAVAWASREPARLAGATGLAPGIAWSRRIITADGRLVALPNRPPDDQVVKEPRDERVPVLLVRGETRRGAMIGFTCHPVTVQVQPLVSADYPGVACDLVERELGLAGCLFLQGACGDINPVRATTDFTDVAIYGQSLGGEALRLLSLLEGKGEASMAEALAVGSEVVELERRPLPEIEPLERQAAELEARIARAMDPESRREAVAALRRVVEPLTLARLGGGPVSVEAQAIRLGDALIVALAGEPFVQIGLRLKEASPAPVTFVAGYANGYEGYIPPAEAFAEGGYEVSAGPWARVWGTAGDELVARTSALARRVWEDGAPSRGRSG